MGKSEIIELNDGFNNIVTSNENNNDLKGIIIYKNFQGESINKDEPVILEIKKGFNLVELFEELKQSSKILHYYKNETKIKMPKFAIGIIFSYYSIKCDSELALLKSHYKNNPYIYLKHITDIINKNHLNVVISVIKDSKISEYELYKEEWKIKDYYARVNINLMNKEMGLGRQKKN